MKKQIFKRAVSWLLAVGMTLSPSFTGLAAIPSFAEEGGITESVSEEAPETTETTDTEETQDGEQETALYTVAVSVNDTAMGTASASPDTDVEAGTEIILSYSANEGYEFVEWSVMPETVVITDNKFTMPEENVSVSAVFKAVETAPAVYAVAVDVNDTAMGTASASPDADVEAGTEITLSYSANEGYEFVEWSVMPETVVITDNKFTMPEENVSVSAVFKAVETVPVIEASETYIYTVTNGTDTSSFATMEEVKEWIDGKKDSDADYKITINSEEDVTVSGDSISFAYAGSVEFVAPSANNQIIYITNDATFNYDMTITNCRFLVRKCDSTITISCENNTITLNGGQINISDNSNICNLNELILNNNSWLFFTNTTVSIESIVLYDINSRINIYGSQLTLGDIECDNVYYSDFFHMDLDSELTITGCISGTTQFGINLSGSSAPADGTVIFKATNSEFTTENMYAVYTDYINEVTIDYDLYLENGEVKVKIKSDLFTVTNGTDTESFASMADVKEWIDGKADPDGEYIINYNGDASNYEVDSSDIAFKYAKSVAFNQTIYHFNGNAEINYELTTDGLCYFSADSLSIAKINNTEFTSFVFDVAVLSIGELQINNTYNYVNKIQFYPDTQTVEIGAITTNRSLEMHIPLTADVTISGKISLTGNSIILIPLNGYAHASVSDGTAILTVKDSSVTADMFTSYSKANDELCEYTPYIEDETVKLKKSAVMYTLNNGTETKEFASMAEIKTYIDEKADSNAEYVITYTGSGSPIDINGSDIEFLYAKSVTFKFSNDRFGFIYLKNTDGCTDIEYDIIFESIIVYIYDSFNCKNNDITLDNAQLYFDNLASTESAVEIRTVNDTSVFGNNLIEINDVLHSINISEINIYSNIGVNAVKGSLTIGDINLYGSTGNSYTSKLYIGFSENSDIKITGKITKDENTIINLIGRNEGEPAIVPDGITALTATDSSVTADMFQSSYQAVIDRVSDGEKTETCTYTVYKEGTAIKLKRFIPLIVSCGSKSANVASLVEAVEWIDAQNNPSGDYVITGNKDVLNESTPISGYDLEFNCNSITFTSPTINTEGISGIQIQKSLASYSLGNNTVFNCDVIADAPINFTGENDITIEKITFDDNGSIGTILLEGTLTINELNTKTQNTNAQITLYENKCVIGNVNGNLYLFGLNNNCTITGKINGKIYSNISNTTRNSDGTLESSLLEDGTTILTVEDSSVTADNFEITGFKSSYVDGEYSSQTYQYTVYREGNEIKVKDPVEVDPNEGGDEEDDTDNSVTVSDGDDTTGYETLEEAMTAISKSTGDVTITLSENAEIKTLTLPARAKSVTIKGEGTLTIGNTSLTVPCNTVIENTLISNSAAPAAIKVSAGKTLTLNGTVQNFGTVSGTATSKLIVNTDTEFKALSTFGEVTVADGKTLTVSGAVNGVTLLNGALELTNSASTAAITNIGSAELTLVETDGKLPKVTVTNVTEALMLTVENETGYLASGTTVLYTVKNNYTDKITISNTNSLGQKLDPILYKTEIRAEYANAVNVNGKNFPNLEKAVESMTETGVDYVITLKEAANVKNLVLPKKAGSITINGEPLTIGNTKLSLSTDTTINCTIIPDNKKGTLDISAAKGTTLTIGTDLSLNALTGTATTNLITDSDLTVNKLTSFGSVNTGDNGSITVNSTASGIVLLDGIIKLTGAKTTASITNIGTAEIVLVDANGVLPKATVVNVNNALDVTVENETGTLASGTAVLYTTRNDFTSKVNITNLTASSQELKPFIYGKEIRAEYAEAILMNGEGYPNLEKAFETITKAKDSSAEYVININEDVKSEKLALPKYAASITLRSDNANTINVGKLTSIAANTNLTIENIRFVTTGRSLTINAKKNLTVDGLYGNVTALKGGAKFALNWNGEDENTAKADITGFGTVNVSDKLTTGKNFNAAKLVLEDNAKLVMAASTAKASVKAITAGNASMIEFEADAIPLTFTGKDADLTAPTGLTITGEVVNGQAVIVSKNIILDKLNNFITPANENITYGFTRIGSNIFYMGNVLRVTGVDSANAFTEEYALWSEAIAAVSSKTADYTITLLDDYNANGAVKFPKAGTYNSLTIKSIDEAKDFNFTGSLALTGKTVFENVNIGAVKNNAYTKYTINAGKNDLSIINCGLASVSAISGTGSMDLECVNVTGNVRAGNLRLSGRNTITNGLTATGLSFGENAELTMYNGSKLNVSKTGISGDNTLTLHIIDKLTGTHSALKAGTIISASFKGAYSNQIVLDEQNGSFQIVLNGTKLVTK